MFSVFSKISYIEMDSMCLLHLNMVVYFEQQTILSIAFQKRKKKRK